MNRQPRAAACILTLGVCLGLAACERVHEPWVQNGAAWKEQHFASEVPNQALDQRLLTTQTDR